MTEKPMNEEASKRLEAFNSQQNDWFAFCPKCTKRISGTLKELQEHHCGPEA